MADAEPGFKVPEDLHYTKNHEWARIEDGTATFGITDYAQNALGDITYVELPEEGDTLSQEKVFGTVDSLKTVAELFAPLSGDVVEINSDVPTEAEKVNEDPYGEGWIVKIEISNDAEVENLLTAEDYLKFITKKARKKA
jgi:glycine cleavage system H protein